MGSILNLGSLSNLPRLEATEHADAAADRALMESGRHALDMSCPPVSATRRPSMADLAAMARQAVKMPKRIKAALRLAALPCGASFLPC